MKKIRISNRVNLIIDISDEATPAMVEAMNGKYTSTYDCATATGCVDDEVTLTDAECAALNVYEDEVNEAYEIARKDNPEYN